MLKPPKTWFWGPSWPRFSRPLEVLKLPEGVLGRTWDVFRPPLSPKNATLNTISNYSKKKLKKPPQKTGVGGTGTCSLGARGNARFREKWGQNLVFFVFFENSDFQAPVKGGFGGSQMTSLMSCRALYMQIYYAWL